MKRWSRAPCNAAMSPSTPRESASACYWLMSAWPLVPAWKPREVAPAALGATDLDRPKLLRMGVIEPLVVSLLRNAGKPVTLRDIHNAVEAQLQREISRSTVKAALARLARNPNAEVRAVARGVYAT